MIFLEQHELAKKYGAVTLLYTFAHAWSVYPSLAY